MNGYRNDNYTTPIDHFAVPNGSYIWLSWQVDLTEALALCKIAQIS